MASGPQPAVGGTSSDAGGGNPARTADPRRGAEPARTRSDPSSRSAGPAPTQRQVVVAGPNGGLPVGPGSGRQAPRRGEDRRPRVVQGRRTRRVVRKIDVWTVLKMSLLFYLCVLLVFLVAGVVLWNIAQYFDVINSVDKFIKSLFDLSSFTFRPSVVLQSSVLGGGVLVLLGTGANVMAALIYNLISDVVGGVQFIVLEETTPSD